MELIAYQPHLFPLNLVGLRDDDNRMAQECGEPTDEVHHHAREFISPFIERPPVDGENNFRDAGDTRGECAEGGGFRTI